MANVVSNGNSIKGEPGDYAGWSVALSKDGNYLAVGSNYSDNPVGNSGHVRLLKATPEQGWEEKVTVNGLYLDGQQGLVVLDEDGKTMVIGSKVSVNIFDTYEPANAKHTMSIKVVSLAVDNSGRNVVLTTGEKFYHITKHEDGTWEEKDFGDTPSKKVSISGNGRFAVIYNKENKPVVYDLKTTILVSTTDGKNLYTANNIIVDNPENKAVSGLSLNFAGDTLLVQTVDGADVYQLSTLGEIQRKGNTISGVGSLKNAGTAGSLTSINDKGNIVALGQPFNDTDMDTSSGKVHIYKYNDLNQRWDAMVENGLTINRTDYEDSNTGRQRDYTGYSTSLNGAGDRLAVGVPYIGDENNERGLVLVYNYRNNAWTSETQVTSSGSGDPYISNLRGIKYKLPNKYAIYRCFETTINNKDLIVNTSVSQLKESEANRLKAAFPGMYNLSEDGYFFDKFFISYGGSYAVINRDIEVVESNLEGLDEDSFSLKYDMEPKVFSCPLQGESQYTSVTINIRGVGIQLMKMEHPQIINGINVSCNESMVDNVKGLLNMDCPSDCIVKSIKNVKHVVGKNKKGTLIPFDDNWVPFAIHT